MTWRTRYSVAIDVPSSRNAQQVSDLAFAVAGGGAKLENLEPLAAELTTPGGIAAHAAALPAGVVP